VEIMTAEYLELLRVPGIGPKSALRIVKARGHGAIRASSLPHLGVIMRRAKWFITVGGRLPDREGADSFGGSSFPSTAAPPASRMLESPQMLRRVLLDPVFREDPTLQPELPCNEST
ncbi:MAG TPA: hypothetical protein VN437_03060, partial [Rectinemataceae bacterium]|nr:hypothetical protein [Rectinemataceae bacterium]